MDAAFQVNQAGNIADGTNALIKGGHSGQSRGDRGEKGSQATCRAASGDSRRRRNARGICVYEVGVRGRYDMPRTPET